jgi:hypothetical protein
MNMFLSVFFLSWKLFSAHEIKENQKGESGESRALLKEGRGSK